MANIYIQTILDTPFNLTIDLDRYTDAEEIQTELDTLIEKAQSRGAEEIEVADWDGDEIPRSIANTINPDLWLAWVDAYDEHGDALLAFMNNEYYNDIGDVDDLEEAVERFEDAYQGEYEDEEDYARDLLESTGELNAIPENLRYYFDYEAYARDLFYGDVYALKAPGGGIFVYWNQ